MSAKFGGRRVFQTDPLQQAPQGRALCGLGTTEALFRRGSRGLQITSQIDLNTSVRLARADSLALEQRPQKKNAPDSRYLANLVFKPIRAVTVECERD